MRDKDDQLWDGINRDKRSHSTSVVKGKSLEQCLHY